MKRIKKRALAVALAIVMLIAMFPVTGSAQQLAQTEQPARSSEAAVQPTEGSITAEPITGTEVISLREENVKHFDMGNGTFRAIAYSHPVHELDENGQWQDIDFSLSPSQTRGVSTYENKAAGVSFPATYTQGQPILSLSGEGNSIEMTFLAPAAAVKRGASATSAARVSNPTNTFRTIQEASEATFSSTLVYEDVLPDVDFEYIVEPDGVKENIVVNTKKSSYCYEFCLQLENLVPELEPEGSVAIFDPATGELRYAIPAPIMYDGAYTVSEAVRYQLSGSDGNYTLTVMADEEWINAEERVFPVKIDPSLVSGTVYDACIFQDEPDTTRYLTSTLWVRFNRISYLKAPNMNLPAGTTLDWAKLEAYYYYNDNITSGQLTVGAYQILNNWSAAVLTWNNASNNPNMGIATTPLSTAVTYGNVGATIDSPHKAAFNITDAARAWTSGAANNYGIALKYVSGPNLSVIFKSFESAGDYKPRFVFQYFMDNVKLYGIPPTEAEVDHDHLSVLNTVSEGFVSFGYSTPVISYGNINANTFKTSIQNATIFATRSHGEYLTDENGVIYGTAIRLDNRDSTVRFSSAEIPGHYATTAYIGEADDFSNIDIAIFAGCLTAYGVDVGMNLPQAMVARGAKVAIGFSESVECKAANVWMDTFISEMLGGKTVREAVEEAEKESSLADGVLNGIWCTQVYGDTSFTLYDLEED